MNFVLVCVPDIVAVPPVVAEVIGITKFAVVVAKVITKVVLFVVYRLKCTTCPLMVGLGSVIVIEAVAFTK